MGEETELLETETADIKTLSHKRILFLMAFTAVLLSSYGFIYISWQFSGGVILGGILSFVNYYWLKHSLRVVFEQAVDEGEKPTYSGTRYILRYFVLGFILLMVYLTKAVSVVGVILGLSSFAFAIVIEGFIRIFLSFKK
jgi:hypothetical protein